METSPSAPLRCLSNFGLWLGVQGSGIWVGGRELTRDELAGTSRKDKAEKDDELATKCRWCNCMLRAISTVVNT